MTKQEKIREGIRQIWNDYKLGRSPTGESIWVVDAILSYLHSQGVVIKVDRELPQEGLYLPGDFRHPNWLTKDEVQSIMDLAVEPLIEEEK